MATKTQNLVAVTPGGDITDDMIVGSYTWMSIAEALIPVSRVRKAFKDAGLDVDRIPKERRPEHVAQEACRQVERVVTNGKRIEIRAEQVDRTRDALIYQITRHVQDKENRVVEHPKALRVLFVFATGTLEFEPLDGASMEDVQSLVDEITEHFEKNGARMPGHKLRTIVRHYIEEVGAEKMSRSGGTYFMPRINPIPTSSKLWAHHGDVVNGSLLLEAMQSALEAIYKDDAEFHIVPCVNDEGQRAFIKRKFIENTAEDAKAFRDECMELIADKDKRVRGFRTDLRSRLVEKKQIMEARRAQFAGILGETLDELSRDMDLADKALVKFLNEADA